MANRDTGGPPILWFIYGETIISIGITIYLLGICEIGFTYKDPLIMGQGMVLFGIFSIFFSIYKHIRYPLPRCRKCGYKLLPANSKYCNLCGTKLR
jgi:hypothetical protein